MHPVDALPKSAQRRQMLVLADAFPVPSETFIHDHVCGMANRGWDVTLLVRHLHAMVPVISAEGTLRVLEIPPPRVNTWLRAISWLMRHPSCLRNALMRRCALHGARLALSPEFSNAPDVVHAHYGNNGLSAMIADPTLQSRLVVNFHGHDVTSLPQRHGWQPIREILGTTAAIAHSRFVQRRLENNTRLQVHRVTMGVDLERFVSPPKLGLWPRPLRLLSAGRLSRQKGHDIAIDALRILREKHPALDAQLTIVGGGPERDNLQALVEDFHVEPYVHGLNWLPYGQMPGAFADADILLLPSRVGDDGSEEAFCRVAIEGMACGLPVVCCPSGGLPDTVGGAGLVAEGFLGTQLASAILSVVDQHRPSRWAAIARSRAEQFSIECMQREYHALALAIADNAHHAAST